MNTEITSYADARAVVAKLCTLGDQLLTVNSEDEIIAVSEEIMTKSELVKEFKDSVQLKLVIDNDGVKLMPSIPYLGVCILESVQ